MQKEGKTQKIVGDKESGLGGEKYGINNEKRNQNR